ncbi:PREDICTED: DNA-binding protein modulo [Bactrocera latifrons]|uniref:DNA-binding protein modulo n=1 Tax=Bactrocera latifrons TaxID=174628 RepID=A0A0K8V8A2_BACLA|nr:PREDICTED: DNA-binding protein modulo [Bactrocera latifrons]
MKQRKSNVGVKSPLNGVKNDSIVKRQKNSEVSTPAKGTPAKNNQKKLGKTPVKEVPPKKVELEEEEEEESEEEEDSGADVAEDVVNEGEDSEAEDEEDNDNDDDDNENDDDDESEEEDENIEELVENEAEEVDEPEDDSEEDDDEEPAEVPIEKRASESSAKDKSKKPKSSDETGVQKIKTGALPKDFPKEQVLIVKNLPKKYKQIELVEIFAKFGTLDTIYNIHGPASCVAYVAYTSPEEAEAAQEATDKIAKVKGAVLKVSIQTPNAKKLKKAEALKEKKKKIEETKDRTIYVRNLKFGTTEDQIRSHFANCGAIESVNLYKKNPFPPTCFVCFEDESALPSAFKLHNSILNDNNIWVYKTHEIKGELAKDPQRTILLKNNSNLSNFEFSKLEGIFSKCGEIDVESSRIICKRNVLAFVTFKDQKAAKKALKLNGTSAQGIDLEIEEYKVIIPKNKSTVFIQNIKPGVTEEEIRELFASTGPIENVNVISNFATVRFADTDSFCKAFLLNESTLRGQVIFLEPYSEKKKDVLRKIHHKAPFNRKRPAGSQFNSFAKRSKPN